MKSRMKLYTVILVGGEGNTIMRTYRGHTPYEAMAVAWIDVRYGEDGCICGCVEGVQRVYLEEHEYDKQEEDKEVQRCKVYEQA